MNLITNEMTTISVSIDDMDESHSNQTDAAHDNNKKHAKHVKRKTKTTGGSTTTNTSTKKRNEGKGGKAKGGSQVFRVLKHKRRYCREPGCDKIVKSQGLCQRHGAKPKKCSVVECIKQAQGSYNGMCKSHFRMYQKNGPPSITQQSTASEKSTTTIHRPRITQYCEPIVSVAEDDETVPRTLSDSTDEVVLDIVSSSANVMWDTTMFGSTEALAEDIAILQSSCERNGQQQQSSSYPTGSTQRTGTVSPHEQIIEKPHRVVRWSTEDTFNFDDINGTTRTTMVRAPIRNDSYSAGTEIGFLQQRPMAISKRNFSTDTNFSVDVALIDQDLDCEHAFDEYEIDATLETVNGRTVVQQSEVPFSVSYTKV